MKHPTAILSSLKLRPRKRSSQNFLTSPHWADKLASLVFEAQPQIVWEIGPGLGALTQHLIKAPQLVGFELDPKLSDHLKTQFPNLTLVQGDFLKIDLAPLLPKEKRIALISNLPYHVSSPIFFKLLEYREHFSRLILTFQKEFADRLIAKTRTPNYGATSVLAQMAFEITNIGVLSANCFYPRPEVASRALLLIPNTPLPVAWDPFRDLVKQAFLHRRKKMLNNLEGRFSCIDWGSVFQKQGISSNTRAEELNLKAYVRLTQALIHLRKIEQDATQD